MDKYLADAKSAIEGSKSKEQLFKAVENLANALKEVQNLENLDLKAKKEELNSYRKYCDSAAELMKNTEEIAPYAVGTIRKGLPILNNNLRDLIEEIRKKTEVIREQTKGTQFEQLGDELNQSSQFLMQVRDPVGFKKQVDIIQSTLKAICSKFPQGQKSEACELLEMMYVEPSIEDKIPLINNILSKFSYQMDMITHLIKIEEKLDSVRFDIFKNKLNNGNIFSNLDSMKTELRRLNETVNLNTLSIEKLNSSQSEKLSNLNSDILERLNEIKTLIENLPKNKDTQEFYAKLNELKQSKPEMLFQKSVDVTSLIGFALQLYQQFGPV